jgi:hypothetical protein
MQREKCTKIGCDEYAVVVLRVYTDEGPKEIASCIKHLLSISEVIDLMVGGIIQGEQLED